ncbi:hypothetical protein Dimus_032026, partial [Dionaea muscipula]
LDGGATRGERAHWRPAADDEERLDARRRRPMAGEGGRASGGESRRREPREGDRSGEEISRRWSSIRPW